MIRSLFVIVIAFSMLFSAALTVQATPLKGYEAMQVISSGGGKITLKPGESKQVMIGFQNIGTSVWTNDSTAYVSIYTYEPKYRTSIFADASWYKPTQPAKLKEARVAPGEVGHILFTLKAPSRIGTYKETFNLAAEETAWIPGGLFSLNVEVAETAVAPAPAPVTTPTPAPVPVSPTDGLSALLLLRSEKTVTAEGGAPVSYTIGVKNTGTVGWVRREVRTPAVLIAAVAPDTRHVSWLSTTQLVANATGTVEPGALDFFTFTFSAPRTTGTYVVRYVLAANDQVVPNFSIDIPVTVTSNAPNIINEPILPPSTSTQTPAVPTVQYMDEPIMRIGILIVDEETDWEIKVSCRSDWELRDINTALLGELPAGSSVTAFYKNGKYWFNRGLGLEASSFALRFIPKEPNTLCTVENFDRRVTRNTAYADNTFRNILELRYNSTKDRTWLINELPMELYLRGLAETSNVSHLEYQKALITGARTYAFYHWQRGTKHGAEFYHIGAYADDQVYRGYGQEERTPRLTQSVEETRGQIVTYEGRTAITPYFSRSDGRTRDWSEVWGGTVAWLKSVPTPCDAGKTLWGHGVGMSASEALCQANAGKSWSDILSYFYQGITLERKW